MMSYLKNFLRQAACSRALKAVVLVSAGSLVNAIGAFFSQTLIANRLSPSDFGSFMSSLAAVNIFTPLAAFGTPQFILKVYGKNSLRFGKWLSAIKALVVRSSIITLGAAALWAVVSPGISHTGVSFRLMPAVLATSACSIMVVLAQTESRFSSVMFWQVAHNAARLLFVGGALLLSQSKLTDFADAYGLAAVILTVVAYPAFTRYVTSQRSSESSYESTVGRATVLRHTWVYAVEGFIYLGYYNAPIMIIGAVAGAAGAGFYAVGAAILTASYLVPAAIFQRFFLGRLHRAAYHDRLYISSFLGRTAAASGVIGLFASGVLVFSAERVVSLLYGESYGDATIIIKILALSLPFRFAAYAPDSVMSTRANQHVKLRIMLAMVAVCAILVTALSSWKGAQGGAIAYVIAEMTYFFTMHVYASKRSK